MKIEYSITDKKDRIDILMMYGNKSSKSELYKTQWRVMNEKFGIDLSAQIIRNMLKDLFDISHDDEETLNKVIDEHAEVVGKMYTEINKGKNI